MKIFIDGKPLGECVDYVALDRFLNPPLGKTGRDLRNQLVQRIRFKTDRVDWESLALYMTTDPFEWVDAAYKFMNREMERAK